MKKFLTFIFKLPTAVIIIALILTGVGLFNTCIGAYNLTTYAELDKRAVTVEATVIRDTQSTRPSDEQPLHNYTYRFTLDGKTYETSEITTTYHAVGSTVTLRVDGNDPTKMVKDDGFSQLTTGIIALSVGLFALIFSIVRVKKSGTPMQFRDLLYLLLYCAALALGTWGACLMIDLQLLAGILLLCGSLVFVGGSLMFKRFVK